MSEEEHVIIFRVKGAMTGGHVAEGVEGPWGWSGKEGRMVVGAAGL